MKYFQLREISDKCIHCIYSQCNCDLVIFSKLYESLHCESKVRRCTLDHIFANCQFQNSFTGTLSSKFSCVVMAKDPTNGHHTSNALKCYLVYIYFRKLQFCVHWCTVLLKDVLPRAVIYGRLQLL